jgi:hypothetical protein
MEMTGASENEAIKASCQSVVMARRPDGFTTPRAEVK